MIKYKKIVFDLVVCNIFIHYKKFVSGKLINVWKIQKIKIIKVHNYKLKYIFIFGNKQFKY